MMNSICEAFHSAYVPIEENAPVICIGSLSEAPIYGSKITDWDENGERIFASLLKQMAVMMSLRIHKLYCLCYPYGCFLSNYCKGAFTMKRGIRIYIKYRSSFLCIPHQSSSWIHLKRSSYNH